MSDSHGDIGPELRRLAQAILDRLDPALQAAASAAEGRGGPGRCQQVWCPVCALAALVNGEQHPLLAVVAEHSVSLMTVISAMVADVQRAGEPRGQRDNQPSEETPPPPADGDFAPPPPGTAAGDGAPVGNGAPAGNGARNGDATSRYQQIPIVVEPVPADD